MSQAKPRAPPVARWSRQIDSSASNPWGYPKDAHSVLTEHYSDAEGSPTREALEQVLAFFSERLDVTA